MSTVIVSIQQASAAWLQRHPDTLYSFGVVSVVAVEEPDEDVIVKDDYPHPERRSSR